MEDTSKDNLYPKWLQTLVHGPMIKVISWPMYFCRGYIFHTYDYGKDRTSANYGVCVKGITSCGSSEEPDFYGVLREIFELHYPGPVHLKVVLFKCDWYDLITERGIRINKSGIIDVIVGKRHGKYDPFILASQADQVCYVPYPRIKQKNDQNWKAAIVIQPRGKVLVSKNLDFTAMQYENVDPIVCVDPVHVETLAHVHGQTEDLDYMEEEEELGSEAEDGNPDIEISDEEFD